MSSSPSPPTSSPPLYQRPWFIGLIVVAALLVGIGLGAASNSDRVAGGTSTTLTLETSTSSSVPSSTTSTIVTTTTSTTLRSTTTTAETTTTQARGEFDSFTREGNGDEVFEFAIPDEAAAVLDITHSGSSNFIVTAYSASNERVENLINEIGNYDGTVAANFRTDRIIGILEIQADGPWSITARPLSSLDFNDSQASGVGDDVVFIQVESFSMNVTHRGDSNFIVTAWTSDETSNLVNEIGDYSGTVRTPTGPVFYEILADGEWALAEG